MIENWRQLLYLLLGSLPPLFFGSRSLIQWVQSERKKRSVVGKLFWQLSLCGNSLLALHYFIQFQYPFLLIQIVNAFIAWRNLNLLQTRKLPLQLRKSILLLVSLLLGGCICCLLQNNYSSIQTSILSPPVGRIIKGEFSFHFTWHLFGLLGGILFASRFWVQWMFTEKKQQSQLGPYFWVMSLIGSSCCLLYFLSIFDWISAIHHSFGMIPYLRNLILLRAETKTKFSA